jgi:hypothetical protein
VLAGTLLYYYVPGNHERSGGSLDNFRAAFGQTSHGSAPTSSAFPNVHIGRPEGLRPWHAALLDPTTDHLTALRPATITLAVTVNTTIRTATVRLTLPAALSAA